MGNFCQGMHVRVKKCCVDSVGSIVVECDRKGGGGGGGGGGKVKRAE